MNGVGKKGKVIVIKMTLYFKLLISLSTKSTLSSVLGNKIELIELKKLFKAMQTTQNQDFSQE